MKRPSTPTFEKQMIAKLDQEGSVRLALQGMVELMEQHLRSCQKCGDCEEIEAVLERMARGLRIRE